MRQSRCPNLSQRCSLRVLIIHDCRSAPPAVDGFLRSAGIQVKVVPLGDQVLNEVRVHAPDVVLLAAGGPESAGALFVRTLRSLPGRPGIVLVADGGGSTELCLADDFVARGVAPAELVLRIEVLAARRALSGADASLQAGPVWIDTQARRVRVDGRSVSLTTTEFELLCLLVRNAGRVVTRSVILDHVWRYDFQGESNIVEANIYGLRRKLADADRSVIRTVRGIGYLLAVDGSTEM
jgi:two-component system, OmpR family, response regulator